MYVNKVYQMAVDSYGDVRTLVVGITYQRPDDWEYIMDSLNEDSNLYLIKEPDNPKDPLAIAAYLDDRRVGYVAASDNGKIWLYLTDEKMPCSYLESFGASFKISFENPRALFEDMPFEEIYMGKDGVTDESYAHFDIPFLTNPKDKSYDWFDDRTYIMDLEQYIPDFRRKLASRLIVLVGRKNSKGEYLYYLPYSNSPVEYVRDDTVKGIIDRYGFVIALPDVPVINSHGSIIMDLHVTYIKDTNFKDFDLANHSELVFNLISEYDYKKQNAVNNQSSANSKNNKGCKNESNEENDLFLQEPESTPSYSKSDYILKKGETINYSIDKKSFEKIDRITTELYSFVRKVLFPSMELFGFIKKQTPYAMQISGFKEYEILIKIFIIKDLGRIYKGLNHSVNFDTAEGKAILLYMEKDVGEDTEVSFETFKEICNPKTRLEPAKKMRQILEELMTSYYEFSIVLWTDTDFMIHSFLKDVNKEWAKRYLELIRQFASAIDDADEKKTDSSAHSSENSLSIIDDFFPLFGVTLGKTTWKQAEDMGYRIKVRKDGLGRHTNVGDLAFWDYKGIGVFTSLYWLYDSYNHTDFPQSWISKGFSWELSYDEWQDVFRELGFEMKVTKQPRQREYFGRNTLSAEFEALSPDATLLFTMSFDCGENGCYTSSPRSLESITVDCKDENDTELSKSESAEKKEKTPTKLEQKGEYYSVTDSPDGGKHVSMNVIVPEEGDEDFEFCSYRCSITDKTQISIITEYMKRFEEEKESRPFLMIGRSCLGLDDIDIFYSLDGEIIFNFIFDDKIKGWIREAGFVLGKVKEYHLYDKDSKLAITLSVSKRKSGEILYNQASEEAMDFIEEYTDSSADSEVEEIIIKAVEDFKKSKSASPYKIFIIPENGIGACRTIDGDKIATVVDDEIIELAEKNKGVFGYITDVDYDDDDEHKTNVWFTIKVSRSIPRITLDKESELPESVNATHDTTSNSTNKRDCDPIQPSISEKIFAKFISDNIGCDVLNAPNFSWQYVTTDFLGNLSRQYETYIFKKYVLNNPKCKKIIANVVEGEIVNFSLDTVMTKEEIYDFVYKYKKLFFPGYTIEKCKKEYVNNLYSIFIDGIRPGLSINFSPMINSVSIIFYTTFCNKDYIVKKKAKGEILTLQ